MKNYTAIYSTEKIKDIEYAFKAKDMKSAKEYAKNKFAVKKVRIIED